MRILWISTLGSWTEPLLKQMAVNAGGATIALLIPSENSTRLSTAPENVAVFYAPLPIKALYKNMSYEVFLNFKKIIDDFKPDIIHVHGTERNCAQIQNFITGIPVIISIQGIMLGNSHFSLNFLEKKHYIKFSSLKNIFGYGGASYMTKLFLNSSKYEPDIFKQGKYFIGRTDWDKANIFFRNPQAQYFRGEELLRAPFYDKAKKWSSDKCNKHTVFMPSGFIPLKGLHWAVESIALLKKIYPGVKLYVPGIPQHFSAQTKLKQMLLGESYITYIFNKIKKLDIQENVVFLQHLTADEMADQMLKAHVFLSPTSLDNSPNAVGEAMMVGLPIVITPVGGVTSFMRDTETCLFAPPGDPYMMAYQIKKIFEDAELAQGLSNRAFKVAQQRHNIAEVGNGYFDIYQKAISHHQHQKH